MRAIGVRELKSKLSEYLRFVAAGEVVLVTDRGRVVAELRKPSQSGFSEHPVLIEMAAQAKVILGSSNGPELYGEFLLKSEAGTARKLLDEDRDER